jgi:hypothetical protein
MPASTRLESFAFRAGRLLAQDEMAVGAGCRELVSEPESLIYRENTGKSVETGPSW